MSRMAVRPGRRVWVGWATAAVAAGLPAARVVADSNYVGGEGVGNWSVAENWSPVGVPTAGANVNFVNADGLNRTLNYDYAGPAVTLGYLNIDQTGTGTSTVEMPTGSALSVADTYVGTFGSANFNQSGGTHTTGYLGLSYDAKSRGTYALSGGELRVTAYGATIVGFGGVGEFVHSGGLHGVPALWVGYDNGGSGTYRMRGSARLEVRDWEEVGGSYDLSRGSKGLFDQSGGVHVVSDLVIGGTDTGDGTYRLSGDGVLTVGTFENVSKNGKFEQTGGTHTITGPLSVVGSATVPAVYSISAGNLSAKQLTVGGRGTNGASLPGTMTVAGGTTTITSTVIIAGGGGALNLSGGSLTAASLQNDGAVTATGGTFTGALVNGGTVRASRGAVLTVAGGVSGSDAASTAASRLVLETGATVVASFVRQGSLELNGSTANPPPAAPVLSIRPKAQGGATSVVGALAIGTDSQGAPLGRVDLADTALAVDYAPGASPISTIRSLIAAGRAGGAWTGNGLSSSVAAGSNGGALGYAEASTVLGTAGGAFAGQAVDGTAVLVRYTVLGDATVDGAVGFNDLLALAKHYNMSNAQWSDGDFDYDGVVNFNDLLLLAKNYNQGVPTELVTGAPVGFEADLAATFAAVPEPGVVAWAAVTGLGLARRGRRRSAGGGMR